ncbi:MAG: 4'-phosphopantetheinyl transferase superfamily protein [Thermodesulfovibrionales bacterium]
MNVPVSPAACWAKPPSTLSRRKKVVDVWKGGLAADSGNESFLAGLLDSREQETARKFRHEMHARRYVASHAMVRMVLARYLGADPAVIRFVRNKAGKPSLHPGLASPLEFNLSHSAGVVVLAVAPGLPVGIDIEYTGRTADTAGIAQRFFTAAEFEKISRLPEDRQREAFFRCWTRKEAYAKAKGLGISIGLDSFEVPFLAGDPGALLSSDRFPCDAGVWHFLDIPAGEGYVCSLALPESPDQVNYYRFDAADFPGPAEKPGGDH